LNQASRAQSLTARSAAPGQRCADSGPGKAAGNRLVSVRAGHAAPQVDGFHEAPRQPAPQPPASFPPGHRSAPPSSCLHHIGDSLGGTPVWCSSAKRGSAPMAPPRKIFTASTSRRLCGLGAQSGPILTHVGLGTGVGPSRSSGYAPAFRRSKPVRSGSSTSAWAGPFFCGIGPKRLQWRCRVQLSGFGCQAPGSGRSAAGAAPPPRRLRRASGTIRQKGVLGLGVEPELGRCHSGAARAGRASIDSPPVAIGTWSPSQRAPPALWDSSQAIAGGPIHQVAAVVGGPGLSRGTGLLAIHLRNRRPIASRAELVDQNIKPALVAQLAVAALLEMGAHPGEIGPAGRLQPEP